MGGRAGMVQMLDALSGFSGHNETVDVLKAVIGKRIFLARLDKAKDALFLAFDDDGSGIHLLDEGQNCCETRYMSTDDDLTYYAGAEFLGAELRAAPDGPAEYDCHDVQFLVIKTSKGEFVMSNHNEHNGYYGGFSVVARRVS